MSNEELDKLSALIENEIHATHSISDKLWQMIKNVVESIPTIHEPLTIMKNQAVDLSPFAFKLFQYMISSLKSVLPEATDKTTQHVSNVVLIKAFKYFPNNIEIYIAYAIHRILDDRDKFIKECFEDKLIKTFNTSTIAGNLLACWMMIALISAIVFIYVSMKRRKTINEIRANPYNDNIDKKSHKKLKKKKHNT